MTTMASRYIAFLLCVAVPACGSTAATQVAEPRPAGPPAEVTAEAPPQIAAAGGAPAAEPPAVKPAFVLGATATNRLGSVPVGFGLKLGAKAPDATLPDISGKPQRLASLWEQGPTFVVFYRGGWCPFCNLQLHGLTAAKPDFDERGIRIVAISVDTPGEEAKVQAKLGVPFPMLSDSKLAAHKAYNVVHVPPEAEAMGLASYGIDLDKYSGQSHHSFAVPSIFLVDRAGRILWQHVDEDPTVRPTPAQMIDVASRTLTK